MEESSVVLVHKNCFSSSLVERDAVKYSLSLFQWGCSLVLVQLAHFELVKGLSYFSLVLVLLVPNA